MSGLRYCFVCLVFLATPALVVSGALAALGGTLADCAPIWNDEIGYWNEINCFRAAGFSGGYCVLDEQTASASWSHFGIHGPTFAVIYGVPAKLLGWHPTSGPFFNFAALLAAMAIWVRVVRPTGLTLAVGALLIATFWPLTLVLPSTMQDPVHYSFAFLIAAATHAWTADMSDARRLWPAMILIGLAAVVRITWAPVLAALWIVAASRLGKRKALLWGAIVLFTLPVLWWQRNYLCSPWPWQVMQQIHDLLFSPELGRIELAQTLSVEWHLFLNPTEWMDYLRWEIAAMICLTTAVACFGSSTRRASAFVALSLFLAALPTCVAYWGTSTRYLAPNILLALLILLSSGIDGRRFVAVVVVAHLLFAPAAWRSFREYHADRMTGRTPTDVFDGIEFCPGADPWDITVLISARAVDRACLTLPPGVGFSTSTDDTPSVRAHDYTNWVRSRPRSKYVLLSNKSPSDMADKWGLELIRRTPNGVLYRSH